MKVSKCAVGIAVACLVLGAVITVGILEFFPTFSSGIDINNFNSIFPSHCGLSSGFPFIVKYTGGQAMSIPEKNSAIVCLDGWSYPDLFLDIVIWAVLVWAFSFLIKKLRK